MDALVMCGGKGTRLDAPVEKPLFEVGGEPMLDRVLTALAAGPVGEVHAVVSPHAPDTRRHVADEWPDVTVVETAGEGYVADLTTALATVGTPAVTVAADLPLLAPEHVARATDAAGDDSLSVCVPVALKRLLGASVDPDATVDGLAPTGLNVVTDAETDTMDPSYDARLAINVNRHSDAVLAERLLDATLEGGPS